MKKEFLISLVLVVIVGGAIIWNMQPKTALLPEAPSTPSQPTGIPSATAPQLITVDEVKKHAVESDCWVIVNNTVYNVTTYIPNHPGGPQQIIPLCGGDATTTFTTRNGKGLHPEKAQATLNSMLVGPLTQ